MPLVNSNKKEPTEATIPEKPTNTGRWTEKEYLERAQAVLEESYSVIDAVFKEETA